MCVFVTCSIFPLRVGCCLPLCFSAARGGKRLPVLFAWALSAGKMCLWLAGSVSFALWAVMPNLLLISSRSEARLSRALISVCAAWCLQTGVVVSSRPSYYRWTCYRPRFRCGVIVRQRNRTVFHKPRRGFFRCVQFVDPTIVDPVHSLCILSGLGSVHIAKRGSHTMFAGVIYFSRSRG